MDDHLYDLRRALLAAKWRYWTLFKQTNGGETADSGVAFRLWALRQNAQELYYAILDAKRRAA